MRGENLDPDKGKATRFNSKTGSKAGKASGKARRLAANFREAAIAILAEEKNLKDADGNIVGKTNGREALMKVLMNKAVKGDLKAIELMLKISGEETTKIELTGKGGHDLFKNHSTKELDSKIKDLMRKLDK